MSQKTDRVIAEILQKRDRFTKNFRTENHGGAAVIYGYPVHYKEGEEWKEIDNRLEKTENGYQNHASRVKVHFAESSNANEMVTIEKMGRKLSWGFLAEKQKKQNIRSQAAVQAQKREAVFQPDNLYPSEEGMQNRAAVQKTEEKSVEQENQEKMSVPGLVAAGHYAEIAENVDLEYKIIGEQVKENLILKSIKAAALEYSFSLQFPGMMIVIREDGGIDLIDEETEEVIYYLKQKFIIKDIKQSISDDQMKVFIFNVIHSMDVENALPIDIKFRAYSIEYSTSSKIYYEEMNDDMKIYVYKDEYTSCIESNSVRLFTELELYKRISLYDYDNNTDKLIEYLHNCKEWEELNSHERKWMSSNFLLQIFVLIFSLMLITMVYKDKNVS